MDIFNKEQITAAIIFFVGLFIITLCTKYERKVNEQLRDPNKRHSMIDGVRDDIVKRRNLIGNILSILGGVVALYGFITFFLNMK